MFANCEMLVAYRTYPHVDMAETGARAAFYLKQRINGMAAPALASRTLPYLIPNPQKTQPPHSGMAQNF